MTPSPACDAAATITAPDRVSAPGRHVIHQRLGTARPRDLLAAAQQSGNPTAAVVAAQITDTAARLDATADTLARKLATLREWTDRLTAGARVSPCFAASPMATLGAEIDMCLHHQDLLREHLQVQIDSYYTALLPAAPTAR